MQGTEIRLQDYIGVVYRKKWILMLSFVLVLGIALYDAFTTPPVYISSATVKIDTRTLSTAGDGAAVRAVAQSVDYYDRIFRTGIFRNELLDSLSADEASIIAQNQNLSLENLVAFNLSLDADAVQSFFRITASASDPDLAYRLADVSSHLFQKRLIDIESESMVESDVYLDEQITILRNKLETKEIEIQNFSREQHIIPGNPGSAGNTGFMAFQTKLDEIEVQRQLTAIKLRIYRQRQDEILRRQYTYNNVDLLLDQIDQEIRSIGAKADSLGSLQATLLNSLDQTHPDVIEINKQIRDIQLKENEVYARIYQTSSPQKQNLLPTLKAKIDAAEDAMFELTTEAEYYDIKIQEFTADGNTAYFNNELHLRRLMRSQELYETNYNVLIQLKEESQLTKATQSGGVKMIDPANRPNTPVPSTASRKILFGAILGMSLGLGAVFLLEYMDTSLKSSDEISRFLQIPLLGEIPKIDVGKPTRKWLGFLPGTIISKEEAYSSRIIAHFDPKDPIVESYRNIRTSLLFTFTSGDPLQAFVISSPNPSEGKSLTTSNLATVFAQSGKKTLIIDTDLRRPVIHKIFGLPKSPGITDVLVGQTDWNEAIHQTDIDNLFVLPAGTSPPNPGEMIGSPRMTEILDILKENMDYVILDTPPVVAAIDAAVLGAKTQGIILVLNMEETKRDSAKFSIEQIQRAGSKVLGGLLNNVDVNRRYGYYYNQYYYRYKYYGNYDTTESENPTTPPI